MKLVAATCLPVPAWAALCQGRLLLARRQLENYAYLVKKYCADLEANTCGPDADLDTIRQQAPLSVSATTAHPRAAFADSEHTGAPAALPTY